MNDVYVVFCGCDGCGKTTVINRIQNSGFDAVFTKEPYLQPEITTMLSQCDDEVEKSYLFASDRYQHMRDVIVPSRASGANIISDRCYLCSLAYQSYQGVDLEWLMDLQPLNLVFPDAVIWFQCDPKIAALRSGENEPMLTGVQRAYGSILNAVDLPAISWHPVNVDGKSEDDVYIETTMLIDGLMRKHEQPI